MKIANIVCTYPPYRGGIGNSAYEFANMLESKGHEVITFTPKYKNVTEVKNIVRIKPWLKYGNGAFLPQLFFKLKNFEIIFLHYPFFGTAEIIWFYKLLHPNKKLIIHYVMDVTGLSPLAKILSAPSYLIRKLLLKQADIIICSSFDYIKNSSISRFYRKNPDKFREIPYSVDIKKFTPIPRKDNKIKIILFVGGLDKAHYFKGLNILFKSLSALKNKDWKLNIVGDGALKNDYKKQTKKLNIENKINFLGSVSNEELPKIYQQADLFILPSTTKGEAFGIVLIEAMASGLPVIASNLPGVRSVFENKKQGLLVEPKNIDDLKNKIQKIINDENKKKEMGEAARKLAEEKYSWIKISKELNKIIDNL